MSEALIGSEGGYYTGRDPLGVDGDFITAPEISQMFGEMIGLWFTQNWLDHGRPDPIRMIELGPGRGTLQADIQRTVRQAVPDFWKAMRVHLVEASPILRDKQAQALKSSTEHEVHWHEDLSSVPEGNAFLVANEFFDALPIRQFKNTEGKWHERLVALSEDGQFTLVDTPKSIASSNALPEPMRQAPSGTIAEVCEPAQAVVRQIAQRFTTHPGQALIIDYGYIGSRPGDTFQAVQNHEFANPLKNPGEADLTAHVDFTTLANIAAGQGLQASPIATQGSFLGAIGIAARAEQLSANADDRQKEQLVSGLGRLTDPDSMGSLFKVLALTSPNLPAPPGFAVH